MLTFSSGLFVSEACMFRSNYAINHDYIETGMITGYVFSSPILGDGSDRSVLQCDRHSCYLGRK